MSEPVNLIWSVPDGDALVAKMARVSNPQNESNNETACRLIRYLIKNKHWSPFEMVSMCVEIKTTRDISRQILRHRSFVFQERSQRYSAVQHTTTTREARLQDLHNRQNSRPLPANDSIIGNAFYAAQCYVWQTAMMAYNRALDMGVAKECARALLPEGLTPTRMYMSGTVRSWLHYCDLRRGNGTQKEHAEIAEACWRVLMRCYPAICTAFGALEESE